MRVHYFVTDFGSPTQGETFIEISGKLEMESTKDHPIRFRSNVVDKQWVGLIVLADGTNLHDFQLIDAVTGIELSADGVRVADAEIRLAKTAIWLSRRAQTKIDGLNIERVRLRDNEKGISNVFRHSNGRLGQIAASEMFILDSEIALNTTGIDVRFVEDSFMSGLDVHHNATGIRIHNSEAQTAFPDDLLIVADSTIRDNDDGVSLTGAGVLDSLLVRGNTDNGVALGSGSQKVKNSLFKQNSADCDLDDVDNINTIRSCGAVYTNPDAHTVLRNNVFKGNFGHGLVLEGAHVAEPAAARSVRPQQHHRAQRGVGDLLLQRSDRLHRVQRVQSQRAAPHGVLLVSLQRGAHRTAAAFSMTIASNGTTSWRGPTRTDSACGRPMPSRH